MDARHVLILLCLFFTSQSSIAQSPPREVLDRLNREVQKATGLQLELKSVRSYVVNDTIPDWERLLLQLPPTMLDSMRKEYDRMFDFHSYLRDKSVPITRRLDSLRPVYEDRRNLTLLKRGFRKPVVQHWTILFLGQDRKGVQVSADENWNILKMTGRQYHPLLFEQPYNEINTLITEHNKLLAQFKKDYVELNNDHALRHRYNKQAHMQDILAARHALADKAKNLDTVELAGKAAKWLAAQGLGASSPRDIVNLGLDSVLTVGGNFEQLEANKENTAHNLAVGKRTLTQTGKYATLSQSQKATIKKNIRTICDGVAPWLQHYNEVMESPSHADLYGVAFDAGALGRVKAYFAPETLGLELIQWQDKAGKTVVRYPSVESTAAIYREMQSVVARLRKFDRENN